MRVWVPVYVRILALLWTIGGRRVRAAPPFRGATGLTIIECIVPLSICAFVSQYIMRVHLQINIFGVGELLILALRACGTVLRVRRIHVGCIDKIG